MIQVKSAIKTGVLVVPMAGLLTSCFGEPIAEVPCESGNGVEVVCGFQQPEDIEPAADGSFLIVSEMGGDFGGTPAPGYFTFYHPQDGDKYRAQIRIEADDNWGDSECPPPESKSFSPHGIHLMEREDGTLQLAAVSHAPREAIELFAVENWGGKMDLVWKGCLTPPGKPYLNDVAVMPDGEVFMTHMYDAGSSMWTLIPSLLLGSDTGFVWSWTAEDGYIQVPGTAGSLPNGITRDDAGERIFVSYYMNNVNRAFDAATGELLASYDVAFPDNVAWAGGSLYIASHDFGFGETESCNGRITTCPLPYSIYRVHPDTMEGIKLVSGDGVPFGTATVAVPVGDSLWMGSYLGDRIAKVPLPDLN